MNAIEKEDLSRLIFSLSPASTPICYFPRESLIQKRKTGSSMRARRRGMMKPTRITYWKPRMYEWRIDAPPVDENMPSRIATFSEFLKA